MITNATYPGQVIVRARALSEAEWSIEEIRGRIEKEFGRRPGWHTVKTWVDPKFAERRRKMIRRANREYALRRTGVRPVRHVSEEWQLARMQEMRSRGVSFRAIGLVAGVWWGEELTDDEVRGKLAGHRTYTKPAREMTNV